MKRPSFLRAFILVGASSACVLLSSACGSSGASDPAGGSDAGTRGRLAEPLHPAASCPVTIETPELLPTKHVPEGTALTFNSNPPSSGPHYPVWANFQEFSTPVDDGYLVHTLEHGAVALLYRCDGAACPPIIEALRKVRDAVPTDPSCDPSVRVRIMIAPYPKLDVPVAAVAWGWTYKAQCVDAPTLSQFVTDNYARSPEDVCAAGRSF